MSSPNGSADPEQFASTGSGKPAAPHPIFEFGGGETEGTPESTTFRLDPVNRLLTTEGKEVPLPGRAFDALQILVRRPGELVTKEELMAQIWAGSFVEESNLTVAISTLRRALNEDPQQRRYIQTVARRGYRFIAEVRQTAELPRSSRPTPTTPVSDLVPETAPILLSSAPTSSRWKGWFPALVFAAFLAVLAVSFWSILRPREKVRTLAVVPLTLTGETGNPSRIPSEVVLLGMTDGLVSRLESLLIVRPTSSMLRYSEGGAVDPVAAGREQGVDAVLTGTLENSTSKATLRLRIVRVRDGLTLWQDTFSGDWDDLPQIVQSAGDKAAAELKRRGVVRPEHKPEAAGPPLPNGQAYQLYLRGRYFWNRRTVDGLRKSVEYFRQSIAADPNYAPAYAGLADSYALLASFSVEPGSSSNVDARSAAFSAIHLDPTLAEPHASLGMIYFFTDWNPIEAETEFQRAIQLNPNYATAHHWYALDLAAMGRFPQALYEIRQAQKLDPLSLIIGTNVGWVEYLARDYPAAQHDLERVLELDPTFARARTRLGMVELARGANEAAAADFSRALASSAEPDPFVLGLLGDAQARSGNAAAAQRTLSALQGRSGSEYVPPISRGLVLLGLGRKPESVVELAKSVDDHSTSMVYAKVDPALDGLRGDAGFSTLLSRMKF